jgi:hypothetical protein
MSLSFDYRRNDIKIKRLEKKIKANEKDDLRERIITRLILMKRFTQEQIWNLLQKIE